MSNLKFSIVEEDQVENNSHSESDQQSRAILPHDDNSSEQNLSHQMQEEYAYPIEEKEMGSDPSVVEEFHKDELFNESVVGKDLVPKVVDEESAELEESMTDFDDIDVGTDERNLREASTKKL